MVLHAHMQRLGLGADFVCPQLSHDPQAAILQVEKLIALCDAAPLLIGSSLGGYYATWLAERYGLRAALVNPAVVAPLSLSEYIGPQTNLYTGETFDFTQAHVDALKALAVPRITHPERYWLLAETGDEVLDYREAVRFYADCKHTILPGGDHSFTRWNDYLDALLDFAHASPAAGNTAAQV